MTPTVEPDDVVVIDQNLTRRRRPPAGELGGRYRHVGRPQSRCGLDA